MAEPPEPTYTCLTCMDYGVITYYHASFDYPIGSDPCPELGNPVAHPPSTPVPQTVTVVDGHRPGCDGTCNYGHPDGCPPF